MPIRIGLIGAGRRRQGLGPFVARDLTAAGLEVCAFSTTTHETADETAAFIERIAGITPRAYVGAEGLLESEPLDALAILSPSRSHESLLARAAELGLHTLCEKPLLWGGADLPGRARACVDSFARRGLLLVENCQWPHVLGAFRALHPDWDPATAPRRFAMRLSPVSRGAEILGDCMPHVFSLLQTLVPAPDPELTEIAFSTRDPQANALEVRFRYRAGGHAVDVEADLREDPEPPRAASIRVDGRAAERRIRVSDYRMSLRDGERDAPLPDPLTAHLRGFASELAAVRAGAPTPDPAPVVERMALLASLLDAFGPAIPGT